MTNQFRAKFTNAQGQIFKVNKVMQTPFGLTVYYVEQHTDQQYSCLIESFSQQFWEIQDKQTG